MSLLYFRGHLDEPLCISIRVCAKITIDIQGGDSWPYLLQLLVIY